MKKDKIKNKTGFKLICTIGIMFFLMVLLISSLSSCVLSLGISPATKEVQYKEQVFTYTIVNNEHRDMNVSIYTEGELSPYIHVLNDTLHFSPDEEYKQFIWEFSPKTYLPQGVLNGNIVAEESLDINGSSGDTMRAKLKVISRVYLLINYQMESIPIELDNISINDNDNSVGANIKNVGSSNLDLKVEILVNNTNGKFFSLSRVVYLKSGEHLSLVMPTNAKLWPGKYKLLITVSQGGRKVQFEKDIIIEMPALKINGYTTNLKKGINKFEINIKSESNIKMNKVHATVNINNNDHNDSITAVTPLYSVEPYGNKILMAYINASKLSPGDYSGNITLFYSGKNETELIKVHIKKSVFSVSNLKFFVFIIPLVLALAILITYFIDYTKMRKGKREKGSHGKKNFLI